VKILLFAALAVVLCACSSSDFHPYVGQQQKWPTSPGTFVDYGRHSNAVDDAAQEAKKLGADAVLVESHGSSSEPAAAFTNASITPIGSGAMVTGSTIIARHHTDRATVLVIKWL
jgi:hypothetical protein